MITPIEIQKTEFKMGTHGYNKAQVDEFKAIVAKDYELLYRQNLDLNDKINSLNDKLQYYSSMEKSLHKALVLAEKSAEETKKSAEANAESIEKEARANAQVIISDAKMQLNYIYDATLDLLKQYEVYRNQIISASKAQVQLLNSEVFKIDSSKLDAYEDYLENRSIVKDSEQEPDNFEETNEEQ
ncbi:MAG: DivIVA domain-containing protein [Clostridiales bacterium]|nr:DivIVA domain-containing protein [Clostridiales bacterium]